MSDLDGWISSFERRLSAIDTQVEACVIELVHFDRRLPVLERLPRLGTAAVEPLKKLMHDPTVEPGARSAAALVALKLGDVDGASAVLIENLSISDEFGPLAARQLALAGVSGASPAILEAIKRSPDRTFDVVTYLEALQLLGTPLPPDMRSQLESLKAREITEALERWFRAD